MLRGTMHSGNPHIRAGHHGVVATTIGVVPAENGEPGDAVRFPVVWLISYADTVPELELAMYKKRPLWSTVAPAGPVPVAREGRAVKVPVAGLSENADTLAPALSAT